MHGAPQMSQGWATKKAQNALKPFLPYPGSHRSLFWNPSSRKGCSAFSLSPRQPHTPWTQWETGNRNNTSKHKTGSKQELAPRGFPIWKAPRDSALSGSRWDPNTNGSGKMLSSWYFWSSRSQGNSRQEMDFPAGKKLGQTFELLDA